MGFVTRLSSRGSVLVIAGAGLLAHLAFKRTETHQPKHLILLLLGIPALLTKILDKHSPTILSAVLTTFAIYWTTLLVSIVLYRLSPWHPLAKYPGPLVCKVTKFWFAFLSTRGKQHLYYAKLHAKYGGVVRVGPNELSIRDVAAVAPMMGPSGLAKGPFWDGRIPEQETFRPMISLRDKMEHTRRRRPWTRAFSTAALKDYEDIVIKRCTQLVDVLEKQAKAVDLSQWVSFFAYDFMGDVAFSGGFEMMRDGDVDGLWHLLNAGQKDAIFISHVPWLGALFLRFPMFAEDIKAFRAHAQRCGITRYKRGSVHKDLFHYLIDEDGVASNRPMVPQAIGDGGLAIIAGSDTASSTISNLFWCLLSNPVTYKRLQAEIDTLDDDVMDFSKQARLPYLSCVINETLRLFPPVLSGSQRATKMNEGGKMVGPYYIPQGTTTFIPTYCLQRDPCNFSPLPDNFLPERWLPAEKQLELELAIFKDQSKVVHNLDAFIPFSTGPSNCVGKNLAWMEMRMLVCLMLQRYDMQFEEGYRPKLWEDDIQDYFVMMKGRLPIVLAPRK